MKLRHAWTLCVLLATTGMVGGCATTGGPLVQPGPNPAGGRLTIDSEMEWTRASTQRSQLWTIDGELLNTLYLVPEVRERDYIFLGRRQTERRPDGPFYQRGMRADELRDLIADGLRLAGFVNVQAINLRPVDFSGREGLRFDFSSSTPDGLAYQGMAAAFEHEKGLALAVFLAPREYYYPRDAAKVSRMLDTLRWK